MSEATKKKIKEPKIIKIDARKSFIEGNMIEIPFLYYGKEDKTGISKTMVEYKWSSNGKDYVVYVEGSSRYGLPTPYDLDVLLALLRIKAKHSKIAYGKNIITMADVTDEHLEIEFSLNEIAKELGKTTTGAVLQRIKRSVRTLVHTTISSQSSELFHNPGGEVHISEEGADYNLIESHVWKTKKGGDASYNKNVVRLGKFFYYSIANSYFKYFDFETYLSLGKNGVAKRMFLLLTKWRNNKASQVIKLETLYERIPLSEKQPMFRKKEVVVNASKALKKSGFILDYEVSKDKIKFIYVSPKIEQKIISSSLEKYTLPAQIIQRLQEHGFTQDEIMFEHINVIMTKQEYIKALLRYTDDIFETRKIKDTKSYILTGLNHTYDVPEKYYNKYTD